VEVFRDLIKEWLVPGSLLFLVMGLFVGVALLFIRGPAALWGRRWLAALLAIYLILSLQGTSDLLSWTLSRGYGQLQSRDAARGAKYIVVLSNGSIHIELVRRGVHALSVPTAYNALEAARVYQLLGGRARVLASGGPTNDDRAESRGVASALRDLGVPAAAIFVEDESSTTYTQGVRVAQWLRERNESTCVLITSPEHMRRATAVMKALRIDVIPSVSAIHYGGRPFWRPTAYALQGSRGAAYEYLALLLYWWRGWI
jgi:uncharacterized SAM-binding protein YcdF (DUF218 family)